MTSQITFLVLFSLLAPSRQQGQYFFGNNQPQRFYQQPAQQFYRTSVPPDYEPDLKTSDVSVEYQHQLPQYQIRRQFPQGSFSAVQQHIPVIPQLNQKPITFYDQTFDPFTSQDFQEEPVRQPVSVRPGTYLGHFAVQPPPRTNNFQVNIPVAVSKQNRKDEPKLIPTSAKSGDRSSTSARGSSGESDELREFGLRRNRVNSEKTSVEKTPVPGNWQSFKKESRPEGQMGDPPPRNRFLIRNHPKKVEEEQEEEEEEVKPSTEKPHTSTIRLRVPFEDQVLPLQRRPIPLSPKHTQVPQAKHEEPEEESEEEEEEEEEEEPEEYSDEYEEHAPEMETHRSKHYMSMLAHHHADNSQQKEKNNPKKESKEEEEEHPSQYDYTSEEEEEIPEEEFSEEEASEEEKNLAETTTQASKQVPTPRPAETNKETTESWVIVASVQTSRSVSGARFLPSGVVNQKERNETLSEDGYQRQNISKTKGKPTTTTTTTTTTSTTTSPKTATSTTSTESIIDKLDRVQSELSSGILSGDFKHLRGGSVLKEMPMPDLPEVETSSEKPQTTTADKIAASTSTTTNSATTTTTTTAAPSTEEDEAEDTTPFFVRRFSPASKRSTTPKPKRKLSSLIESLQFDDLSGLLPPGFKPRNTFRKSTTTTTTKKPPSEETSTEATTERITTRKYSFKPKAKKPESSFGRSLPSGALENKIKFQENISAFLPPDYKAKTEIPTSTAATTAKAKSIQDLLSKIKFEEPTALLPKNYTMKATATPAENQTKPTNTAENKDIESLFSKVKQVDINAFLPPGFKSVTTTAKTTIAEPTSTVTTSVATSSAVVVFPTRLGGISRKPFGHQTTEKPPPTLLPEIPKIQKGWPVRATTAFSGWPTPSTTPISIEKLLEQAKLASSSSAITTTTTSTTTTTTTTTTTPKPTTPGVCSENCELAATIRIVDGVKWIPEYLDRNTKEWQDLANEVESQLDYVYKNSESLSPWYKKVRIDSFSKGSVLVDYFVELSDMGRQVNTQEMKKLFHDSLNEVITVEEDTILSEKIINDHEIDESTERKMEEKKTFKLGKFSVDPKYTDFVVVHRDIYPTVGYAEEENFLPQWAIAVIVIGLASLLFVIIFGVTVLVNRHKNNKKKTPTPLTEDIINEMNKHHIGGFDNYGADDLYGMEDVWNDRGYEKPQKKRSHSSYADNSMTNLYDSWRSDWNGYYYNSYYGNGSGGGSGYGGRRRSDYDTNF